MFDFDQALRGVCAPQQSILVIKMKPLVSAILACFGFLAFGALGLSLNPDEKKAVIDGLSDNKKFDANAESIQGRFEKKGRFTSFLTVALFASIIAAHVFWSGVATAECGPFEDNSQTTYRQLQCADFRGPGSANNAAYIRSSIRVNWTDVLVEPKGEAWVAKFATVCVQAFMHKELSGLYKKKCNADSLTHEQHHFHITQYFAQSLGSVLEGLEYRATSQLEAAPGLLDRTKTEHAGTVTRWKKMNVCYDR